MQGVPHADGRANLASSSLFVLTYFPGWYALGKFSSPLVLAMDALGVLVFGPIFGWAIKKMGFLWSAYILHALNNLLVVALLDDRSRARLPTLATFLTRSGRCDICFL